MWSDSGDAQDGEVRVTVSNAVLITTTTTPIARSPFISPTSDVICSSAQHRAPVRRLGHSSGGLPHIW